MKTKEEKIQIAKKMNAVDLLHWYDVYKDTFNPVDEYFIETFFVLKDEILTRLKQNT